MNDDPFFHETYHATTPFTCRREGVTAKLSRARVQRTVFSIEREAVYYMITFESAANLLVPGDGVDQLVLRSLVPIAAPQRIGSMKSSERGGTTGALNDIRGCAVMEHLILRLHMRLG